MVLAFTGAPAAFPIQQPNVDLQRYLVWSDAIDTKAETFIQQNLKRPFLGIHMRNGIDWVSPLFTHMSLEVQLTKAVLYVIRVLKSVQFVTLVCVEIGCAGASV